MFHTHHHHHKMYLIQTHDNYFGNSRSNRSYATPQDLNLKKEILSLQAFVSKLLLLKCKHSKFSVLGLGFLCERLIQHPYICLQITCQTCLLACRNLGLILMCDVTFLCWRRLNDCLLIRACQKWKRLQQLMDAAPGLLPLIGTEGKLQFLSNTRKHRRGFN